MTAAQLLQELSGLGIRVSAVSGRLKVRAPKGAITPVLKSALGGFKAELLSILSNMQQDGAVPLVCWYCAAPWMDGQKACPRCLAIAPGLTDEEADAFIYGPGAWL